MIVLFPFLILIACLATLPAFLWSKRTGPESRWLMFLAVPGIVVWLGLASLGFGAQSLSNLVEVVWLVGAGMVLPYLKVLVQPRLPVGPRGITYALLAVLAVAAILLRALMPVLPE